jgi:hypothetical protein
VGGRDDPTDNLQFEDRKVCKAVVLLTANLMVQVILEDTNIRRVVSVYG